jgi:Na+/proline symporter
MNIWQLILVVFVFAIGFSLWTTSEATQAMLIVMCVGVSIVVITLQAIMRLFQLLGEFGDKPNRKTFMRMALRGSQLLAICAVSVGIILWVGFYLLWPEF